MAALYAVVAVSGGHRVSMAACLTIALPVAAAILAYTQWICFPASRTHVSLSAIAASFALWMQIEEAVTLMMPLHHYNFPIDLTTRDIRLGGIAIRRDLIAVAALAAVSFAMVSSFLNRTRDGLALRAAAQDGDAAALCGISLARVWIVTWLISAVLGTVAAVSIAAIDRAVTPMMGLSLTLKSLIVIAIGGTATLRGLLIGGFVLGLFEAYAQAAAGAQVREFAIYLLLFLWLALRPSLHQNVFSLLQAGRGERA
jgi:branched-chain amino acid transport system permease protein